MPSCICEACGTQYTQSERQTAMLYMCGRPSACRVERAEVDHSRCNEKNVQASDGGRADEVQ
jgi:hypothetical protein